MCEGFVKNKKVLVLLFVSANGVASPWAEVNDPFLRSDILALADSGMIESPVNAFPLPWSSVGVIALDANRADLTMARSHVLYQRSSAQLNRGNRALTLSGCDDCRQGYFAAPDDEQASLGVSYEHASRRWAYRIATQAIYDQSDYDYQWQGSYLAWQVFDSTTVTLGYLPRWWGPSWQHNLTLDASGDDVSVDLTSGGQNLLGAWHITSVLTDVDRDGYHYRWSNRAQIKPASWLEVGYSAHYWFDKQNRPSSLQDDFQQSADIQIALPNVAGWSQRVYGEATTQAERHDLGAYVLGWSGQIGFDRHALRLVIESQTVADESQLSLEKVADSMSVSRRYQYQHSMSFASYLQLSNDHQLSFILSKQYDGYIEDERNLEVNYQLPLLSGRFNIGAGFSSFDDQSIWSRYQFRF